LDEPYTLDEIVATVKLIIFELANTPASAHARLATQPA